MADVEELRTRFRNFAIESTTRAPLYARLSTAVADDAELIGLLGEAPPGQQIPVLLFAAVHDLLLQGLGSDLAAWYPNLAGLDRPPTGDVVDAFRAFSHDHADRIRDIVVTRNTQTNEVGRCALFLVALARVAREAERLSLVDVGASAGLNLLLPRYAYDYGSVSVGGPSPVVLECGVRGRVELPADIPPVAAAIGIDHSPIDVRDDAAVRWLEACVWPDQADRFDRLRAAIELGRTHPPDVRRGDAIADLFEVVSAASEHGHTVVLNSWVLSYLSVDEQRAYVAELDRLGAVGDVSWVAAESPALTPGLPIPTTPEPEQRTVLSLTRWRRGVRTVERLGTAHPHGFWLHADDARGDETAQ